MKGPHEGWSGTYLLEYSVHDRILWHVWVFSTLTSAGSFSMFMSVVKLASGQCYCTE